MAFASSQRGHDAPSSFPDNPNRAFGRDRAPSPVSEQDRPRGEPATEREMRIGRAQAWIGIGLGLAGLLMPRRTSSLTGLPYWPALLRVVGARELASGIGLIAQPRSQGWRWARIAGDAMDGAVLATAFFAPSAERRRLAVTTAVVGAIVALDIRAGAARRDNPDQER